MIKNNMIKNFNKKISTPLAMAIIIIAIILFGCGVTYYYAIKQQGFVINSNNRVARNIQGGWYWRQDSYRSEDGLLNPSVDLSLQLRLEKEDQIIGSWFGSMYDGNKVNGCFSEDGENCIQGTIKNNVATVVFSNTYGGGEGEAILIYNPEEDSLMWNIIKKPEGEYYAPASTVLNRKK